LSGGERNRVQLAKLLRVGGNVLCLDEPTNDLDLLTLGVLEEALEHFPGCVLCVSHDRWFLDRVATAILAFEGPPDRQQVTFHEGNYSDYLARRAAEVGAAKRAAPSPDAARAPKRPAVRRLTLPEQRELGQIESTIEAAEATVGRLEAELLDPA